MWERLRRYFPIVLIMDVEVIKADNGKLRFLVTFNLY